MKNKGITLIALVITIIILLILAGISINALTGENGIIEKVKIARIYSRESEAKEYLMLEIQKINMDKEGNISLNNILNEFKNENKTDIIVTEIVTKNVSMLSDDISELPNGDPVEITVVVENYEEFNFTIEEECAITKICGVDVDEWAGETLNTPKTETTKITIQATPSSQTESSTDKQEVELLVSSSKGWINWEGKYAWNTSSTQKPSEDEWKSLTLEDKSEQEKTGKVEKTASEAQDYYLWVKITTNGKTVTQKFGAYKLKPVPTENDLVCVLKSKSDNDTKGIVEVGSTKTFEGWKLSYTKNSGTETEITDGTTIEINVVKNDYIEVIYSKSGETDVIKTLTVTELKIGYVLNYDATEGTGGPTSQTQYDNTTFTISSSIPTRTGYNFVGWTINSDRTGTVYSASGTITVTGTTTLYAKWEEPRAIVASGSTIINGITYTNSYEIWNANQLKDFRNKVNNGTSFANCIIMQKADINLNNENWTPIGNETNKFNGTYDGEEHTINNLKIESNGYYVGFFGYNIGTIKNLTVDGTITKTTGSGSQEWIFVGGIVGKSLGTIQNCTNKATINGQSIDESTKSLELGGIVGDCGNSSYDTNELSVVDGCTNEGSITVTLSNCNIPTVGGIAGAAWNDLAQLSNLTNKGDITVNCSNEFNAPYIGGIARRNQYC